MVTKIQSLSFVLLMIMLFSSVVSGQDRPNLIIGGIWQTAKDQETNQVYANDLNAEYVHTYYTGWKYNPQDVAAVTDATPQMTVYKDPSTGAIVPVPETASYKPTDLNGLTSDLLSQGQSNPSDHYDTIYAHSGGARTAVTALLYQHVTADTLVLISPAMGPMDRELYLWEIQQLLDLGIVKEIVVYQSAVDTPWFNEQWLGKFNPGEIEGNFNIIGVSKEQLGGKTGNAAHEQLWYTALNLELGRDPLSPTPTSLEDTTSAADVADDFSRDTGLWSYSGNAYRDAQNGYIVLTSNKDLQVGNIWLNQDIASPFTIEFRYKAGEGTGADGLTLMFYKDKNYEPGKGGWLGFSPETGEVAPGYGIEFDNYENSDFSDPTERHIALIKDSVVNHLRSAVDQRTEDNQWHQVKVEVNTRSIVVYVDGDQVINFDGDIDTNYGGLGFSAATWSCNNWHLIDDVRIST
jgi:hypothetical protein